MKNKSFAAVLACLLMLAVLSLTLSTFAQKRASEYTTHDRNRKPPEKITPGEKPWDRPSDAIALFDGKNLNEWRTNKKGKAPGWKVENGYMEVTRTGSIFTKKTFGDCQLHIEWASPDPPKGSDQGCGNSGIKLMGHYEIQVLESSKNVTYTDGQAAAIYGQYPPLINASKPPGEWQTFDIIFRRPRRDENDKVIKPAYMTVFHNGVLVQDHEEILGNTSGKSRSYRNHGDKESIMLQDHGNPVRYRNIWIRELPEPRLP